ncbi:hypothetical protein ADEAN_000777400 [Angomonas deanei]|uniref:Uncharacterized protein n=1 Tax=Angomonas deanei TaxID=59799 RepID=A0A7G2CLF5_9TRYP|nr:hypothetical protein ADEAN_000777400 [Angomonas deanei]
MEEPVQCVRYITVVSSENVRVVFPLAAAVNATLFKELIDGIQATQMHLGNGECDELFGERLEPPTEDGVDSGEAYTSYASSYPNVCKGTVNREGELTLTIQLPCIELNIMTLTAEFLVLKTLSSEEEQFSSGEKVMEKLKVFLPNSHLLNLQLLLASDFLGS